MTYSGTQQSITLTRLSQPTTTDYLMAKIPVGGNGVFYTVELRTWAGADAALTVAGRPFFGQLMPAEGVAIQRIDPSAPGGVDTYTLTVNATDTYNSPGVVWTKGARFTDQANNIGIRIDDFNNLAGTAKVTIGASNLT